MISQMRKKDLSKKKVGFLCCDFVVWGVFGVINIWYTLILFFLFIYYIATTAHILND